MKVCTKVKFASIQAIKDHLKTKKEVGYTTPYYCHQCCSFHYTSLKSKQDKKIEELTESIKKLSSELVNLKNENRRLKNFEGLTQLSNRKSIDLIIKQFKKMEKPPLILVQKEALERIIDMMVSGNYSKSYNPNSSTSNGVGS